MSERFRRRRLVWPLAALLAILAALSWWSYHNLRETVRKRMGQHLQAILDASVTALAFWFDHQRATVRAMAAEPDVYRRVATLAAANGDPTALGEFDELSGNLAPVCRANGYVGFVLFLAEGGIATWSPERGSAWYPGRSPEASVRAAFAGTASVTRPRRWSTWVPQAPGGDQPVMLALAPVSVEGRDDPVAALGFLLPPEGEFTDILRVARAAVTGETYALDTDGFMLSASRFEPSLVEMGLLREGESSILNVEVRDPGVDLRHQRPLPEAPRPLTRMAERATQGGNGMDLEGYPDYRGVPAIGAWAFLAEPGIAVATEIDVYEAYDPVRGLGWNLFLLLALLTGASVLLVVGTYEARHRLGVAEEKIRELGQYTLGEIVGQGGMGTVYRATHRLMSRPVAVKLLHRDKVNPLSVGRFEREIEMTSRLTHPNTVTLYDYGRTPDGHFYYAMELLNGIDLQNVLRLDGPQPEERVIHVLRQVCGSLGEAHRVGLIHRDIKAANIMLCERGGLYDFVKVLDFGLVKPEGETDEERLTLAGEPPGTPAYLAPEVFLGFAPLDRRSDVYSLGIVAYQALTGSTPFHGPSSQVIVGHVQRSPEPPSQRLKRPIDESLEALVLRCLAKMAEDRPQSMEELDEALARCPSCGRWTQERARQWWQLYPVVRV